jgi:hypothetical protein
MANSHCTHSWLGSFAGRLIQLRPRLSVGSAVTCAVSSFHHAADIDPHRAAEIFASAIPVVGTAKKPVDRQNEPRAAKRLTPVRFSFRVRDSATTRSMQTA